MSKLQYKGRFTTPSGKECFLDLLKNEDYFVLVKYIEGENKKMFLESLDSLISETIPDFAELDIVDKLYTYIVFCLYSIKSDISVINKMMGNTEQTIPLSVILNNIEKSYSPKQTTYDIGCSVCVSYPRNFSFEDGEITIDYLSAIDSVSVKSETWHLHSDKMRKSLCEKLGRKMFKLVESIRKESMVVDIFKGVPMNSFKVDLLNPGTFDMVFQIYKDSLDNFYDRLYTSIEYLKISYRDFMEMTPIDSLILRNRFIEDKKRQEEEMKKKRGTTSLG